MRGTLRFHVRLGLCLVATSLGESDHGHCSRQRLAILRNEGGTPQGRTSPRAGHCPHDVAEDGETIGCSTCSTGERMSGMLSRTLDHFVQGHFTSRDTDEAVVFMSSACGVSGGGEDYLVSRLSSSSESVRLIGTERADDAMMLRRRDGRTGIVLRSEFVKQGETHSWVKACSIGTPSRLDCEVLLRGVSLARKCPPQTDPRTDVDRISVSLADVDGDGLTDLSLGVEYSSWPALRRDEAYQLALSTGSAEDPSPIALRVPEPTRGTATLVYLNRADRFEPTAAAVARTKAIETTPP